MNKISVFSILVILLSISFFSCNKEKIVAQESKKFAYNDWNWDERKIYFNLNIAEIEDPCKVVFDIYHDKGIYFGNLSFEMTIFAPDGSQTTKQIVSHYDKILDETGTISTVVAFSEKYFNQTGNYTFEIYRRYDKFNFFGINSVNLKVIKLPKVKN